MTITNEQIDALWANGQHSKYFSHRDFARDVLALAAQAGAQEPVAWVVCAEVDGVMVPQWPAALSIEDAERHANHYMRGNKAEVRPLVYAAPQASAAAPEPDMRAVAPPDDDCPDCHGSGERQYMTTGHGPDDYDVTVPCVSCGGTGAAAVQGAPAGWTAPTESEIDAYIEDHAPECDVACHEPSEFERVMLKDAIMWLLSAIAPAMQSVERLTDEEIAGACNENRCGIEHSVFPEVAFSRGARWAESAVLAKNGLVGREKDNG